SVALRRSFCGTGSAAAARAAASPSPTMAMLSHENFIAKGLLAAGVSGETYRPPRRLAHDAGPITSRLEGQAAAGLRHLGVFRRGAESALFPVAEIGIVENGAIIRLAGRVERRGVGPEAGHHRAVHGVGDSVVAEQERAAVLPAPAIARLGPD